MERGTARPVLAAATAGQALLPLPISAVDARAAAATALRRPYAVDTTKTVLAHVRRQAEAAPAAVAVVDATGPVTYSRLIDRVAVIRSLVKAGCGAGDVVAAMGPRSADTVAVFLALESIGAVYLPIDPTWPAARRRTSSAAAARRCW